MSGSSQPSPAITAQNTAASATTVSASAHEQHPQEPRVAELPQRPPEIDDKAHPSIQVISAATSGRGRSGGGVAQVPR